MPGILNIGISSLKAHQALLNTVSHNISNASTEGYSRQNTELVPTLPVQVGSYLVGTGVSVGLTSRVVDDLLIGIHRDNISRESSLVSEEDFFNRINILLSDTNTGISQSMNSFFASIQEMANDPASAEHRAVFLGQADNFVTRLNVLDGRLDEQIKDINSQTKRIVTQVNAIVESLARLNSDISVTANLGSFASPSDLLDQRDRLLNKLGELIGVTVLEQPDGAVDVFVGSGQTLVIGAQFNTLDTALNSEDPSKLDVRSITGGFPIVITDVISGGKLGGLNEVRSLIEPTQASLNRLAITMAMSMNAQHQLGIDLNGDLGRNIFNDPNDLPVQLNRVLANDLNNGNAVFRVEIDPIQRPDSGPFKVFGTPGNLVNSGTLTPINAGDLSINGIAIGAAVSDTLSTTDATASAIATANAINATTAIGITAKAEVNSLYLGTFTTGAYLAGEFTINGQNVITAGVDEATLLRDINALSQTTGVRATGDGNLNITLFADDGRNIQLTSSISTPVATFQYFDTASAVALNQVQRAGVTLISTDPNTPITIAGLAPGDVGLTAGTTPAVASSLTDSNYSLFYDGSNYVLRRLSDNVVVANTTSSTIQADGFTLHLHNGAVAANDRYAINPLASGSKQFALALDKKNVKKIAMASPITTFSEPQNSQNGNTIKRIKVLDTSGLPASTTTVLGNGFQNARQLTPPIRIEFFNDSAGNTTRYRVFDISNGIPGVQIGPDQTFIPDQDNEIFPITSVVDTTAPGPNPTVVYDPGYRVTIGGTPKAGDAFRIQYNTNAGGDDGNANEFVTMLREHLLSNGTEDYQSTYNALVAQVGSVTQTVRANREAASSLTRQSNARIQSVSGVNLDEEATKLIRFQQAYRAAAQVISVGNHLFDDLFAIFR